jgi:gamma-glutamyltranspeptidase/glutathione hydrolase
MFARILCVSVWLLGTITGTPAFAASPEAKYGSGGMVAARSRLAAQAGAYILKTGGNAIDAAVATGFALAVTYPSAGNLAGGGFMVIRLADGTVITNDHREKAPAAASRDMYLDASGKIVPGLSTASHLAVGVPGSVDGMLAALERYGTKSRKEVMKPAIAYAKSGIMLTRDLALDIERELPAFSKYPATMKVFAKKDGTPYEEGDVLRQPDLAATLERIASKGRDGFYAGKTAELIVAEMKRGGGLITLEDLANYKSVWREPIKGTYRGYEIYSMPPPSSGGVLLVQMLNMLEPFDVKALGFGSAATVHLMVEAERRAYADRAEHLGDPDVYDVPVERLISKDYAAERFRSFDPRRASKSADIAAGSIPPESQQTTHLSVIDAAGNAVAFTTTLNLSYGAKIVADGTGMLLNNEMDDFSSKENTPNAFGLLGRSANAIEPNKRMLSSMTPTIVTKNGAPVLATGSPGGSTIITTVLQVIVNVIDHGMSLSSAVGVPRFHHQWMPDAVIYEPFAFSPDTLKLLREKGHALRELTWDRGLGDANSVMKVDKDLLGVVDPRNEGAAVGF